MIINGAIRSTNAGDIVSIINFLQDKINEISHLKSSISSENARTGSQTSFQLGRWIRIDRKYSVTLFLSYPVIIVTENFTFL